MAEQNNDQEKTEEPTKKKLEKAREEGNVSKSQELNSAFMLLISALIIYFLGDYMYDKAVKLYQESYKVAQKDLNGVDSAAAYLGDAFAMGVQIITPVLIVMFAGGVLISVVQTGFIFTTKVLEPKGNRIDPFQGLQRVFSMNGLVELLKGVIRLVAIGIIILSGPIWIFCYHLYSCLYPLFLKRPATLYWFF